MSTMATCKECKNCYIRVGYWFCKAIGNYKRKNPLVALEFEGVETCDFFIPKNTDYFPQSTLSMYIKEAA